jgi:uncharacterized protein (TIGR03086 family)
MASFDLLDRAAGEFDKRLRLVTDDQRELPTPCGEFNVRDLVTHQIQGMRGFTLLLNGQAREGAAAFEGGDIGSDDWVGVFNDEYQTMRDTFAAPGVLERTVTHPIMGDIPAAMLFDIRMNELAVHGWDLARAIGADETLDPEVVISIWEFGAPMAEMLPALGIFGSGGSGTVSESAPLQTRLLDMLGRRP